MSAKILGIDIGSVKICAAMVEATSDEEVSLIAISTAESKGVKKGAITNIELAASAIKTAVDDVLRIAGTQYDRVIDMNNEEKADNYVPNPIDVSDIVLPEELTELTEIIAKNVHEVWSLGRIEDGWIYGGERDTEKKEQNLYKIWIRS